MISTMHNSKAVEETTGAAQLSLHIILTHSLELIYRTTNCVASTMFLGTPNDGHTLLFHIMHIAR